MKTWTDKDDRTWREVMAADDVTEEVLDIARDVVDGWYADGPIDWENVWDRMDGPTNGDWYLSMGTEYDTPAQRKIQRVIRKERREG